MWVDLGSFPGLGLYSPWGLKESTQLSDFHFIGLGAQVTLFLKITSPGWMHETSAQTWCTGKTQRYRVEKEVGGGIGMGNTCISKADSCQCMTKTTTIL